MLAKNNSAFHERLCPSFCQSRFEILHFTLFVWENLTSVSERDIFLKNLTDTDTDTDKKL